MGLGGGVEARARFVIGAVGVGVLHPGAFAARQVDHHHVRPAGPRRAGVGGQGQHHLPAPHRHTGRGLGRQGDLLPAVQFDQPAAARPAGPCVDGKAARLQRQQPLRQRGPPVAGLRPEQGAVRTVDFGHPGAVCLVSAQLPAGGRVGARGIQQADAFGGRGPVDHRIPPQQGAPAAAVNRVKIAQPPVVQGGGGFLPGLGGGAVRLPARLPGRRAAGQGPSRQRQTEQRGPCLGFSLHTSSPRWLPKSGLYP